MPLGCQAHIHHLLRTSRPQTTRSLPWHSSWGSCIYDGDSPSCCRWLREETKHKSKAPSAADGGKADAEMVLAEWSNGYAPGRMTSSLKHSSNAVMRM